MLSNKKKPVDVIKACFLIMAIAIAFSFVSTAFSARTYAQTAESSDDLPSFRNLGGIIPNSRDLPRVSLGTFLRNIAETTGIYAFVNDRIEKETTILDEATGKFKTTPVVGWQELLMVAVGFIIVYLGAAKGMLTKTVPKPMGIRSRGSKPLAAPR